MQDHTPISSTNFQGLYDRSVTEDVPFKYFISALNLRYEDGCFFTREGSNIEFPKLGIRRIKQCLLEGQAPVELILDSTGSLFDATDSLVTPIMYIAGMTDFSAVTLNDRIYISPHDGLRGLPGERVYVYDGSIARPAAGIRPATPITVVTGGPGNIEIGVHCFTVIFETQSGFLSGYTMGSAHQASGGQCVNISNIPLGPAGTIKRHILGTRTIISFNGDALNQQYHFIPNGEIPDNVTTIKNDVNFYDSQLVEDASYLQDALDTIPAGVHISTYLGSLVVCGENTQPDLVRVSYPGEPENFDGVEGFIRFGPDGAGTVENTFELRGQLFVCKRTRTYVTQTNGESAIFWNFTDIDLAKGTTCHGVALIESTDGSNTNDLALVCDRQGLYAFTGTFNENMELSWPITKLWKRINKRALHTIEAVVSSIMEAVYIAVPLDDALTPSHVLYADFSAGMSAEFIRWCIWKFPVPPTTIAVVPEQGALSTYFRYASTDLNRFDRNLRNDRDEAIECHARFAYTATGYPSQVNHYCGVALFAVGLGELELTGYSLRDARVFDFPRYQLRAKPEFYLTRGFSVNTEKLSVEIRNTLPDQWFRVSSYTIFCKPIATTRPNYA